MMINGRPAPKEKGDIAIAVALDCTEKRSSVVLTSSARVEE